MRAFIKRLKPTSGFAHFIHLGLNLLLPAVLLVLARLKFYPLALLLIILSKWRMFAVRPRHWPVHFRINAVDLMVGISILVFMMHSVTGAWQLVWAIVYGIWLVFGKPMTSMLGVAVQALIGQTMALMAIYLQWGAAPLAGLVLAVWLVTYFSARHFFSAFEEPYGSLYSHLWGYFAAALTWVLAHWLLFYGIIAQPTLIMTVLSIGLGTLYYLYETEKLSTLLRRQFVFSMAAVIIAILLLSDWSSKIF